MEVLPNVHLIPNVIANTFLLVDEDGLTLVDAGLPNSQGKILNYLASLGYAPGDLRRILITHADTDHVGSLAALQAASGARLYASPIETEAIAAGRMSRPLKLGGLRWLLFSIAQPFFKARPARVDETLRDGQSLPVLGGLRVVETPGHTPGHLSFYAPGPGILFCGDSLRCVRGKIEVSRGANTWDAALAMQSAKIQAGLGASLLCAGHGQVITQAQAQFRAIPHIDE